MSVMIRLLLIAAGMTALLALMVINQANARAGGTEIRLAMEPVDPRDLLLGHYVELVTPLQRLETAQLQGGSEHVFAQGDRIWVGLESDADGSSLPVSVYPSPRSGTYIEGRVRHAGYVRDEPGQWLTVHYNIERYFASPEAALELEALRNESRLRLIVSLGGSGSAVIRGLEIDGEDHLDRLF
ncbi:GDYXXLXY domain-containing protein [Glycocaulis abyssi]|uniref:GDYXXLXY domain-containing protein n=1 Tax=Glycocaulis abyssi TaxID=1433403 RepID=A0ABV9NAT7_9PROT